MDNEEPASEVESDSQVESESESESSHNIVHHFIPSSDSQVYTFVPAEPEVEHYGLAETHSEPEMEYFGPAGTDTESEELEGPTPPIRHCSRYAVTGVCPDTPNCAFFHDLGSQENSRVVMLENFFNNMNYLRLNEVRDLTSQTQCIFAPDTISPPLQMQEMFEIMHPLLRDVGPVSRIGISEHAMSYLDGHLYVEFCNMNDANSCVRTLGPVILFGEEDKGKLLPNIPWRIYDGLSDVIMSSNLLRRAICRNWTMLYENIKKEKSPMSFRLATCEKQQCDQTRCKRLHLTTTTSDQIYKFELEYQKGYTDEEKKVIRDYLDNQDLEDEEHRNKVKTILGQRKLN